MEYPTPYCEVCDADLTAENFQAPLRGEGWAVATGVCIPCQSTPEGRMIMGIEEDDLTPEVCGPITGLA